VVWLLKLSDWGIFFFFHNCALTEEVLYFYLQPPPPPRMRSKMDSLIVTSDLKAMKMEEAFSADRNQPLALQFSPQEVSKDVVDRETEPEVQVENVERPVDLYKV